jgi:hypothetical protein
MRYVVLFFVGGAGHVVGSPFVVVDTGPSRQLYVLMNCQDSGVFWLQQPIVAVQEFGEIAFGLRVSTNLNYR